MWQRNERMQRYSIKAKRTACQLSSCINHVLTRIQFYWATVCKTVRPMLSDRCPVLSVCNVGMYCGQTVGWIKMPLGTEVGLVPGDTVLDGDPDLPTERGTADPSFWPMSTVAKRSPISATAELLSWLRVHGLTADTARKQGCHFWTPVNTGRLDGPLLIITL